MKIIYFTLFYSILVSCDNKKTKTSIRNKNLAITHDFIIKNNSDSIDYMDSVEKNLPISANFSKNNIELAETFKKLLKDGSDLSSLFAQKWIFIYHEDNRCDGSTDGQLINLSAKDISNAIKLEVFNDGEGWLCDPKQPSTYILQFKLSEKVKDWDRFEINHDDDESIVYISGKGESDYIKIYFDNDGFIARLEYRSEDPG